MPQTSIMRMRGRIERSVGTVRSHGNPDTVLSKGEALLCITSGSSVHRKMHRLQRTLQIVCLAYLALINTQTAEKPFDAVAAIKNLLTAPPVVEEMIFSQNLESTRHLIPSAERSRPLEETAFIFSLRWQSNGFLLRQLSTTNEASTFDITGMFFCYFQTNYFNLDFGRIPYRFVESSRRQPTAAKLPMNIRIRFVESQIVMALGIHNVLPGTFTWNRNAFAAASPYPGMSVRGEVLSGQEGSPEVRVTYARSNNATVEYRIVYSFDRPLPLHFPTRILSLRREGDDEIRNDYFEVHSLSTREALMSSTALSPEPFIERHSINVALYEGGSLFRTNALGELIRISGFQGGEEADALRATRYGARYYYCLVLLSSLPFLGLTKRSIGNRSNK